MKTKKCECCGKELINTFNTVKYCSSCALYTMDLRRKLSNVKRRAEQLEKQVIELKFSKEIKQMRKAIK